LHQNGIIVATPQEIDSAERSQASKYRARLHFLRKPHANPRTVLEMAAKTHGEERLRVFEPLRTNMGGKTKQRRVQEVRKGTRKYETAGTTHQNASRAAIVSDCGAVPFSCLIEGKMLESAY
jgi:hypothetical protein